MTKLILGIIVVGILILFIYVVMSVMIVAGRSDAQTDKQNIEFAKEIARKKQLRQKDKATKNPYDTDKETDSHY